MTVVQSIILGIIQGLTEFLPISSSAHLVITPYLLNWQIHPEAAFIFNILVQLGTLLAVILYFRSYLYRIIVEVISGIKRRKPFEHPLARLGWLLVLGTLPAVIAGLLFKDTVELAFGSPVATGLLLLGTAALLVLAEKFGKRGREIETTTWLDALVIGLFQALALLPGISRSGSTITGGMLRGLNRPDAARFSFLLSVPAMLGAGSIAILDLVQATDVSGQLTSISTGFITSAIVGYLSIHWLLSYLTKRSLYIFAVYCVALCVAVLLVSLVRM